MNSIPNKTKTAQPTVPATSWRQWPGHMADDIAATSGPEPLATLTATPEELNLTSTRGNFRLPRTAVTKLGRGNFYPWCFSAVRIHHTVAGVPRDLQFKPLGTTPAEVRLQLQALGYPL